ncbi:MAG: sigma-54-dependent Fis family transcriptional regulator [Deltaproteobacteria bacterium]|nr:sigma-54-dependent Fis family transcriptional regulator [Deltaproteobacteria bacterium]
MTAERKQILLAEDEANLRRVLGAMLTRDGYEVHTAQDGEQAIAILGQHHIETVITDLRMPKVDGLAVLRHVCKEYDNLPVIMITAHGTVDTAVEALKTGAFDYITKPFEREEFRAVVAKALRTQDLQRAEVRVAGVEPGRYRIIGQSPSMMEVYGLLERVADTPSTVLLTGESGTGKELIATALHENSSRRDKPFIRVNCAAIPKDLIESELFGYEKGAFTGAVTSKPGRFELAHGGTLFLDEIGEIPVEMQVKLLRALQESEFERVGGIKTIKVDVRLITATNRDLKQGIGEGSFREDLFYRLNVVNIHLPPLRERTGDIPLLIEHFVRRFNEKLGKKIEGVMPEAMAQLVAHEWPGNIRELENVLERCILFCDTNRIGEPELPAEVRQPMDRQAPEALGMDQPTSLKEKVREAAERVERELIVRALKQTGNNVTHAARLLKISRKSLQMKMKDFGLREER